MQRIALVVSAILFSSIIINCVDYEMDREGENLALQETFYNSGRDSSTWILTPSSGDYQGGDNITLTGSDFSSFFPEVDPWENFTIDSSADVGTYSSIVADSNGELHIAYRDDTNGHLKYASNAGGSWTNYPIDNGGGSIGRYTSIDVDSNDKVHVSYGNLNTWDLKYATNIGGSWTRGTIDDGGTGQAGMYSSLVIDSNDLIHVSYWGRSFDLKYATKQVGSGNWADEIVEWGYMTGEWTSIALDSNDKPFFSHCDETYDRLELGYKSGSSWVTPTIDSGSSGEIDNGTSLAIDSNDAKHIVYYDDDNGDLRYADYNTQSNLWQNTILDSNGDVGKYPSIEIDSQDNIHVAYYDNGNQQLKYAHHNGTSWNISTLDESGGMHPSLTIDSNDNIYISYYDDTNSNLKVIQHIVNSNEPLGEVQVEFVGYGNVTGTVLDDSTITFSSPAGPVAGADVNLVIWLENGSNISPPLVYTYEPYDSDGDGIPDVSDDCVQTYGNSTLDQIGCPDDDGDGYSNSGDEFPNNANEWLDSDGDGVGDNSDSFPHDANESVDSDGDGVGDNSDSFPYDAEESVDTDGDGVGDNADQFPFNANEWEDLDGNLIPDNSEASKVQITSSSEDMRITPYHVYANNLTLTIEVITSEGFTMVDIQSSVPNIIPSTGGLPYGFMGGDNRTISLRGDAIMNAATEAFFTGEYISDVDPWVNFTVHVTGFPHGCVGSEEFWDAEQQAICPNKVANYRTDFYANFTMMLWNGDDDNDGVANSWDRFPLDANESKDSDGDGVGDVKDLCPDTIENETVDGNGCSQSQVDFDGDGYGDDEDDFPLDPTQWLDSDDDGFGDNWADSDWNDSRMSGWPGTFVVNASQPDYCPDVFGNSTDGGYFGCRDADGNGIADLFEKGEANGTGDTNQTTTPVDSDSDGVSDLEDDCPDTPLETVVDSDGCALDDSNDEDTSSVFDPLLSGDTGAITKTVGMGAILLALFTLLQTNAAAAILPDAFRWVQVMRKNSRLTKEEYNELTYLQSVVQAYHANPQELAVELNQLKGDLTARYTNNELKKETREKLFTLIADLLSSSPDELYRIAHNSVYFGLEGSIDSQDRRKMLDEKLAMNDEFNTSVSSQPIQNMTQQGQVMEPSINAVGLVRNDGFEWYEYPKSSGVWWYRIAHSNQLWKKWES